MRGPERGPGHAPARLASLLDRPGAAWAGLGLGATLLHALSEYLLAAALILFLNAMSLLGAGRLPRWIPDAAVRLAPALVLALMLAIGAARAGFQLLSRHSFHAMLERVRARLKAALHYRILLREAEHPDSLSRVSLVLNEHIPKAADFVYYSIELAAHLLLAGVVLAGMAFLAWREALLGIACLTLLAMAVRRLNRAIERVAADVPRERETAERALVRVIRNWMLIRVMRFQRQEYGQAVDSTLRYYVASKRAFFFRNVAVVLPPFFGIAGLVAVAAANLWWFHTPKAELAGFIYLFVSFARSLMPITDDIGLRSLYRPQARTAERILAELPPAERAAALGPMSRFALFGGAGAAGLTQPATPDPAAARGADRPPEITLSGVSFAWPGQERAVLENLSLRIPAGGRFGIIGPNGSGKSTLLALVLGILRPTAGSVLVDGVPGSVGGRHDIVVGYVSDEHFLIPASIRDNLVYGASRTISDREIGEALRRVRLDGVVAALPGGLDHALRENEEGLSSGEKQRLALARAFLRRPQLLILDEASANLDSEAEAVLADILAGMAGDCTIIIVSHKPGMLRGVERILRLEAPAGAAAP